MNGAGAISGAANGAPSGAKYEAWLAPTKQARTTAMAYIFDLVCVDGWLLNFEFLVLVSCCLSCLFVILVVDCRLQVDE